MRAKKSLGQNFLRDEGAIAGIVRALALQRDDTVIEIGSGHGELTARLINRSQPIARLIAIEKDERLCESLRQKFSRSPEVTVVKGDVLRVLPEIIRNSEFKIQNSSYRVVGNIPYYLTGYLLRLLSELDPKPECIVLTIQKDVAERLCAKPPKMNLLAASARFWAEPEEIAAIGRESFRPAPKVDSAVVRLVPHAKTPAKPEDFYPFLRILFGQPRKTILNNLVAGEASRPEKDALAEKLKRLGVDPDGRPQDLALNDILSLAKDLKSSQNG